MIYQDLGVTTLAKLTHEAEDQEDDLTFLAIQNALEQRPEGERNIYRQEYLRLWRDRCDKKRGHREISMGSN